MQSRPQKTFWFPSQLISRDSIANSFPYLLSISRSSAKDLRTQLIISLNSSFGCQCALALLPSNWFKAKLILTHNICALAFKCKYLNTQGIDNAALTLCTCDFSSPNLLFWMINNIFRVHQMYHTTKDPSSLLSGHKKQIKIKTRQRKLLEGRVSRTSKIKATHQSLDLSWIISILPRHWYFQGTSKTQLKDQLHWFYTIKPVGNCIELLNRAVEK